MALSDDKKTRRGTEHPAKASGKGKGNTQSDRDVGHALRSVYSLTVNEDIPTDLLDLLGKLN